MLRNLLDEIQQLNRINVKIRSRENVNRILNGLLADGFDNLQVVTDFDLTITKQHDENGQRHLSSFKIFQKCPSVTKEYAETCLNLLQKYHPLELDPNIPYEEKYKLMYEWYIQSSEALNGLKITRAELDETVAQLQTPFRDGTAELFKKLAERHVPILVFSAGLGDAVVSLLTYHKVLLDNVKVISNFLDYDESGTILGIRPPLIHVLNKNEFAIKKSEYYDLIKDKENVILMGDMLGDAKMADGMSHAKHVLKIGFLWENVEENLKHYMEVFDIVLIDDQTMDVANAIVNHFK